MFPSSDDSGGESHVPRKSGRSRSRSPRDAPLRFQAGSAPVDGGPVTSPVDGGPVTSPAACVTSGGSSSMAVPPRPKSDWREQIENALRQTRDDFGPQLRPLLHDALYAGMNSQAMVFRLFGIQDECLRAAEKKGHARQFVRLQGLLPKRYYEDVVDMLREACAPGDEQYERADLLTGGFPCQPFSSMSRQRVDPTSHALYGEFVRTLEYIEKTLPRVCLLENTMVFVSMRVVCQSSALALATAIILWS